VLLYSELGPDRWEVRKVELHADGRMSFADQERQSGDTHLGLVPVPPLEEMAADPEFEPEAISAEEFESAWRRANADSASTRAPNA